MAYEISNYYEPLVFSAIRRHAHDRFQQMPDHELLEDAACLALNQLPSRYVRHHVDTSFYLTVQERDEMDQAIEQAVRHAFDHLTRHRDKRPDTYSQTD